MPMALTPYGGWHKEDKDLAESWTHKATHTGDGVGYYEFDQRFEHPGRTWASATHRAFSFACVGAAMANETWKFVQAKSKQAMKQVLGIKNEAARMKVTPPLAVATWRMGTTCDGIRTTTALISIHKRAHLSKYTTNK